jgi:ubiquinone/menaquinone biosynthesis C-methylase UbiE
MATFNSPVERTTVKLLRLRGDERVLEIGFGPGVGIALLAARLPHGYICGIDPSDIMNQQAALLKGKAVRQGRIELRLGTADALPWDDGSFEAICSVNNVQLWDPLDASAREVRRVLRTGGRLAIVVRDWWWRDPQGSRDFVAGVEAALEGANLTNVRTHRTWSLSGPALYFTARA